MSHIDAVVVGAGFAGLSAASRLARDGARVLVLEARSRLGGRATAFRDRDTGELVDNGQHALMGCYTETFTFLDTIGASANVQRQTELAVTTIENDGRVSRLCCPSWPPPLHLIAGVFGWSALGLRDKLAVLRLAGPLRQAQARLKAGTTTAGVARASASAGPASTAPRPPETVAAWLARHGQTPRLRELLWDPLALAALNQPPEQAEASLFVRVLAEMFGDDPSAAAIVLPALPLHEMYAEPARVFITARGGDVRTGVTARIALDTASGASVHVAGERLEASAVVCAVPWFALNEVFTGDTAPLAETLEAARATNPSPIVTVNLWFDRAVMDEPFVGLPGRLMQWVFDKRAVLGSGASHLSLVSSGAADVLRWTNPQLIDTALADVRGALPRARAATVVRATVIREPRATFSLEPGQPARPGVRTAVSNLFLAGDWIDTGLPATIESAVRSGHLAAEAALQSCVR